LSKPLRYIAQQSMDLFFQEYKSMTDFFEIEDFVRNAGDAVTQIYEQTYRQVYAELKKEGKDEIVGFEDGILASADLEVKDEKLGDKFVLFGDDVMHFMYSNQDVGIQDIAILSPKCDAGIERITFSKRLNKKYMPKVNKILFYTDNTGIYFQCLGDFSLNKIRVYYVPKASPTMEVPDGIVADVITKTVMMFKEMAKGVVIKESIDNNKNKIPEGEINKQSLKQ